METPIADFVTGYSAARTARFHMPGHKGTGLLGCESLDITEVNGADALYEASGIIAASEENATQLFGSGRTLFSTEGSSQCIRAMLYLALTCRPANAAPVVVAARNVHKAFVYAAALLDLDVAWMWPEGESRSLCGCPISPDGLEETLSQMEQPPAAVYLTSPDYLGGLADISALAQVCHRNGTILIVDNAHGSYLHFLTPPCHPLDLGADLCCDSAHKTLPVLTGGAYLHISKQLSDAFRSRAKAAMALFGSTSPSYLTMASLDLCNRHLSRPEHTADLMSTVKQIGQMRDTLVAKGWTVEPSDPLRLTLRMPAGLTGTELSAALQEQGIHCEYADEQFLVLMATPENTASDWARFLDALGENQRPYEPAEALPLARGERVLSIREALFAPQETIPTQNALGRICGAPAVSCPPAIPIAISGERIGRDALALFEHYGIEFVDIII